MLARAAAARLPAVIDVIGVGPERPSLEAEPGIRLLGPQISETVYAKMREVAYLVVPSVCYEFPLTVVEAFANGLPVIASRLGALAELIRDGETGVLFEAGSADDLARTMAWADAHPGDMARMGRAARHEYELKYTPDRNYEALMEIYRSAINTMQ